MAAGVHLSLAEFLRHQSEPECELIAGLLAPKPMGTLEHMKMERRLAQLLEPFERLGLGQAVWELSIRRGEEVRIPDLVFIGPDARFEDGILVDAPLLCVEILSPSQRLRELFAKCESYHSWGVPYCWTVDPLGRRTWEYHRECPLTPLPAEAILKAGRLEIAVSDLFR